MKATPLALALSAFAVLPARAEKPDLALPPGIRIETGEMKPPAAKPLQMPDAGPVPEPIPLDKELFSRVYRHVFDHCTPQDEDEECCLGGPVPLPKDDRAVSGCMSVRSLERDGMIHQAVIRAETSNFEIALRRPSQAEKDADEVTYFHLTMDGRLTHASRQVLSPSGQAAPRELPASKGLAHECEETARALLFVMPDTEL